MVPAGTTTKHERGGEVRKHTLRRGTEVEALWCSEPVKESDPGDPEHHQMLPPSGEHAEENPSNTDRREPP